MRIVLAVALLAMLSCKSDCEKAAEALCKDWPSKTYDRCYGVQLKLCARGAG